MDTYDVYFEVLITVEAESEEKATKKARQRMHAGLIDNYEIKEIIYEPVQ